MCSSITWFIHSFGLHLNDYYIPALFQPLKIYQCTKQKNPCLRELLSEMDIKPRKWQTVGQKVKLLWRKKLKQGQDLPVTLWQGAAGIRQLQPLCPSVFQSGTLQLALFLLDTPASPLCGHTRELWCPAWWSSPALLGSYFEVSFHCSHIQPLASYVELCIQEAWETHVCYILKIRKGTYSVYFQCPYF